MSRKSRNSRQSFHEKEAAKKNDNNQMMAMMGGRPHAMSDSRLAERRKRTFSKIEVVAGLEAEAGSAERADRGAKIQMRKSAKGGIRKLNSATRTDGQSPKTPGSGGTPKKIARSPSIVNELAVSYLTTPPSSGVSSPWSAPPMVGGSTYSTGSPSNKYLSGYHDVKIGMVTKQDVHANIAKDEERRRKSHQRMLDGGEDPAQSKPRDLARKNRAREKREAAAQEKRLVKRSKEVGAFAMEEKRRGARHANMDPENGGTGGNEDADLPLSLPGIDRKDSSKFGSVGEARPSRAKRRREEAAAQEARRQRAEDRRRQQEAAAERERLALEEANRAKGRRRSSIFSGWSSKKKLVVNDDSGGSGGSGGAERRGSTEGGEGGGGGGGGGGEGGGLSGRRRGSRAAEEEANTPEPLPRADEHDAGADANEAQNSDDNKAKKKKKKNGGGLCVIT